MASGEGKLLLGEKVAAPTEYAPEILYPIAREQGRATLDAKALAQMGGCDIWHAYELSWLDESGRPQVALGRISVPADSPNIIESKSLKLYLNALNNMQYASQDAVAELIGSDLSAVAGAAVAVELLDVDAATLFPSALADYCIDDAPLGEIQDAPSAEQLEAKLGDEVEEVLASHLLRSLCPVTGQPDWATLRIDYAGKALDHGSLLTYLLAYRTHQEFHEQCVERIFCDLYSACEPSRLTVQALYTRRGGLDINPLRSTEPDPIPAPRQIRQ